MGIWSVYVSEEDEELLKTKIKEISAKRRWSFSQAVSEILREHLIDEPKSLSDEARWQMMTAFSFFEGYAEKDSIYDSL